MKKKFSSISQCCHVWAQQTQREGEGGNVFFKGPTIFSYGYPFPLASFLTNKAGEKFVLFNIDHYSVSPSNHQSETRRAVSYVYPHISINDTELVKTIIHFNEEKEPPIALRNFLIHSCELYLKRLIETQSLAAAKRKKPELIAGEIDVVIRALGNIRSLFTYLGLGEIDAALINHIRELHENNATILSDLRQKLDREKKEKLAKAKEIAANAIKRFTSGEAHELTFEEARALKASPIIYLFIHLPQDIIRTSHGAEFPLEHGRKAFPLIQAIKERGGARNIVIRLGHFTITEVNANGDVKAGCHTVKWNEIERNAKLLGLS